MCGILGYSHLTEALPEGLLARALNALVHRGPDHQGTFCSNGFPSGRLGSGFSIWMEVISHCSVPTAMLL